MLFIRNANGSALTIPRENGDCRFAAGARGYHMVVGEKCTEMTL
jgi:hypothetical protein